MMYAHTHSSFTAADLFPDALQSMPVMGAIGDGGAFTPFAHADRPRILTKYFPDDGFHAVRVDTADFDPLYRPGTYLILTTGSIRDAVVSRPALFKQLKTGGHFGLVARVTPDLIHLAAARPPRPAPTLRRDDVEMVYIPIDRLKDWEVRG